MNYIVLDLEFNQDFTSLIDENINKKYPFEIIQIGAVKLDKNLNVIENFNKFIKPSIYSKINPYITDLTGITTEQLANERPFTLIYDEFINFIENTDSIILIWGTSDIKELYKNTEYHKLNTKLLPKKFINIQPFVSLCLGFTTKNLLNLKHAAESLNIPVKDDFHDALIDATYTAEIFKKIYNPSIQPSVYDETFVKTRKRMPKVVVDFDGLINQFEKMYSRKMSEEEQEIIKLAYKMGKTSQFIK